MMDERQEVMNRAVSVLPGGKRISVNDSTTQRIPFPLLHHSSPSHIFLAIFPPQALTDSFIVLR